LSTKPTTSSDLIDAKIQQLEWHCRRKVDHLLSGKYKSIFKGRGLEFDEVRPYSYGDDIRSIDWNVTARSGETHIKRFHEERDHRIIFVLDASATFLWSSLAKGRRDIAAELMALMGSSAAQNNDAIAMLIASHDEKWIPPRRGRSHLNGLLDLWLRLPDHRHPSTLNQGLETLAHLRLKRSIVVVLSDHFSAEVSENIIALNAQHEMIAMELRDPRDFDSGNGGRHFLKDIIHGTSSTFKGRPQKQPSPWSSQLMKEHGVDTLELRLPLDPLSTLIEFFNRRQKHILGETGG
jgi:uncharacterized protein (DUF58 family)